MNVNSRDIGAGTVFLTVAAIYGGTALATLPLGRITNMGPAFFPVVLCAILAVLGAVLLLRGLTARRRVPIGGAVAWRAILTLMPAIAFFGSFIREVGFGPAVALTTFACALASRETGPVQALLLALGVAAGCVAIFIWGVGLPIPVFGSWLTG